MGFKFESANEIFEGADRNVVRMRCWKQRALKKLRDEGTEPQIVKGFNFLRTPGQESEPGTHPCLLTCFLVTYVIYRIILERH